MRPFIYGSVNGIHVINLLETARKMEELKKEIEAGNFREDLFHRLNVIPIHVPSLDDRKDDIPLLVTHFSELICSEQGIQTKTFDKAALEFLMQRSWTGNIRELRNVVERLIILGGVSISKEDVEMFA